MSMQVNGQFLFDRFPDAVDRVVLDNLTGEESASDVNGGNQTALALRGISPDPSLKAIPCVCRRWRDNLIVRSAIWGSDVRMLRQINLQNVQNDLIEGPYHVGLRRLFRDLNVPIERLPTIDELLVNDDLDEVFEIGMNVPNPITRVVQLSEPSTAIVLPFESRPWFARLLAVQGVFVLFPSDLALVMEDNRGIVTRFNSVHEFILGIGGSTDLDSLTGHQNSCIYRLLTGQHPLLRIARGYVPASTPLTQRVNQTRVRIAALTITAALTVTASAYLANWIV